MHIGKGAEATLTEDDGTVVKQRDRKGYRHDRIDEGLRAERTDRECRLLEKAARAGVNVPEVLSQEEYSFSMTYIDGTVLQDVFEARDDVWPVVGRSVARLHAQDIIHGDLTTSNMILHDGRLYLIDFGLGFFSQRIEDRATDLKLLKQVLESTHVSVADEAFEAILDAYRERYDDADDILQRLSEAEGRGRYK